MKKFFGVFSASCLGTIVALMLIPLFFVLIGLLQGGNDTVSSGSILKISDLSIVSEKKGNVALGIDQLMSGGTDVSLRQFEQLMQIAATDKKISAVVLSLKSLPSGPASRDFIRTCLDTVRNAGKPILSYSDFMTQSAYYLNSAADSVFINPNGFIDLRGFGTVIPYYKNVLDKYGVDMNVFYAGDFKSATESYRRTDMSPENREQLSQYLADAFREFALDIAESRNLSLKDVDQATEEYSLKFPEKALDLGFVDGLLYHDQWESLLRDKLNLGEEKKIKYVSLKEYATIHPSDLSDSSDSEIALVYMEGVVDYGNDGPGNIDDTRYIKLLEKLRARDKTKAVILRVNSPGGSALTSDLIWREVERLKEKGKPVIASFGDYAASGGYYIACGADKIVAQRESLTGSIGVYSVYPNYADLMKDKLDITVDSIKTHQYATAFDPFYNINAGEAELVKKETDIIYDLFVSRVAQGREMTPEQVKAIAGGRIYSGEDAFAIGLVDKLGDLNDAIRLTREVTELEDYTIMEYPMISEKPYEKLLKSISSGQALQDLAQEEIELLGHLRSANEVMDLVQNQGVQARLPFLFSY